jgi:hypothetical protein
MGSGPQSLDLTGSLIWKIFSLGEVDIGVSIMIFKLACDRVLFGVGVERVRFVTITFLMSYIRPK